jgi:PAS domain S-box-containing protein
LASLGMRSKLLLLVTVAALPLILLICAELLVDLGRQKENASQLLYQSSHLLGENVDSSMARARDLLILLAEQPDIEFGPAEARDKLLTHTNLRYPEFDSLYFLQTNGIEAGLSLHQPGSPRIDYNDRAYFREALSTSGLTISETPMIGKSSGTWVVPMVQPVRDDNGRLLGFVGGEISLGAIREGFRAERLGPGAQMFLFNADGVVLTHEGDDRNLDGMDLSAEPIWNLALHAQDSMVELEYPKGVPSLARAYRLSFAPWYVALVVPSEVVIGPQMNDFLVQLALAIACLAVGLGLALLLSQRIAQRIRRVAVGAARIGSGDLSQRLDIPGSDETAELATQFNTMAEQLQRSMAGEQAAALRYQRLLGDIADGYVILQDGVIAYANRQLGTMLGLEANSRIGTKLLDLVSPELVSKAEKRLEAYMRGEELKGSSEWELRASDGSLVPVEISSHAIEYLGRPALASVIRDVTQRRQMEEQRVRLIRDGIEGKALRDLLHQKNMLVSTISHELRTPLTLMMGFSEMLCTRKLSQEETQSVCREILSGSLRLKRIVDEIVQFAEVQGPSVVVEPTIVDLADLTRRCVEEIAAEEPRHSFRLDLPEQLHEMQAAVPPGRYQDALGHLLSNAARFSPAGSQVVVSLEVNGANAIVNVADHGVGITREELGRVFEPFFRSEGSYRRAIPGTGLGLAITKRLIELWGGEITACSDVGQGSCFSFTVPLTASQLPNEVASGSCCSCS